MLVILLVFLLLFGYAGKLLALKKKGQLEYSVLGMDYTKSFEQKWLRANSSSMESLLGNQDMRSLADIARSSDVMRTMNIASFDFDTLKFLIMATILPFVPLGLTVIPLQEVLEKMREFLL